MPRSQKDNSSLTAGLAASSVFFFILFVSRTIPGFFVATVLATLAYFGIWLVSRPSKQEEVVQARLSQDEVLQRIEGCAQRVPFPDISEQILEVRRRVEGILRYLKEESEADQWRTYLLDYSTEFLNAAEPFSHFASRQSNSESETADSQTRDVEGFRRILRFTCSITGSAADRIFVVVSGQ